MPQAQIKVVIGLIISLVLGVSITIFAGHYNKLRHASAQNQQRGQVLENTSAGVDDGQQNLWVREAIAEGIREGRENFNITISEAKRNEPETAARADRPVPVSVRDAYRARRLARERSGCAGAECPK